MTATFSLSQTLAATPYFAGLPPHDVETLAQAMVRHTFSAGETIFLEGEESRGMWIIEMGRVKIFKLSPQGEEHILLFLGPANSFNDIAALDDGPNPAHATALTRAIIWMLPKSILQAEMANNPLLARAVVRALTGRVRSLIRQIEDLALYSVKVRLSRFLLKQAEDPALAGPGVTRAAIASHLATTPETVSRALREMEESGVIRFDRHHIVIMNESALQAIAAL